MQQIFDIEKKYPNLANILINDIPFWGVIRTKLKFEILKKGNVRTNLNEKDDRTKQSSGNAINLRIIERSILIVKLLLRSFNTTFQIVVIKARILFSKKPAIIIFTNSLEIKSFNNAYIDKILHDLNISDEHNIIHLNYIEPDIRGLYEKAYPTIKRISHLHINQYFQILSRLKFTPKIKINEADDLLLQMAYKELNVPFTVDDLSNFLLRTRILKIIFKFIKPNCILLECYSYYEAVLAGKLSKNKVIELQHGIIDSNHAGYFSPIKQHKTFVPDTLLSFGINSSLHLNDNFYSPTIFKPIGNFYLDQLKRLDKKLLKKMPSKNEKILPIVVPIDYISQLELTEIVLKISTKTNFFHFYLSIRNENILTKNIPLWDTVRSFKNITISLSTPYQELLLLSYGNLSTDSTCCLEAQYLNKFNFIYNINNKGSLMFKERLKANATHYFTSELEFIDIGLNKLFNYYETDYLKNGESLEDDNYAAYSKTGFFNLLVD